LGPQAISDDVILPLFQSRSANKQGSCRTRIFRSGSFVSNPYMHRSAKPTASYPPQTRGRNYLTIRVAKTLS
jgi:hypothetical protein